MKKKKIDLGRKLLLNKETVAALNATQQHQLVGGINTLYLTCTEDTRAISSCRATRPSPNATCCQIP
ncbi:class I lanthipeptide [Chitinophaga sp. HK235]|uniref:class I lanthipeptide n=1 Tax=Chitinophaga sp. HK235 TaxID=2952571 RepID=UPI001BA96B31|nr:class I lanthipeptide [Chitinophaga sp. HK235]